MSVRDLLKVHGRPSKEVYLDNENSGWVPREVVEAMIPYFNVIGYGHPSITNKPGWEAFELIDEASELIARTLGADKEDINFVHSGTEANNLAILGTAKKSRKRKIIVSDIEHYSVLMPALSLQEQGFKVIRAPVDERGFVLSDVLSELVDSETFLVSIQTVNHEIGTIQRIKELSEIVKDKNPNVIFHTDACDAYMRIPIDLSKLDVDLLTISSHKILGPKGAAALYVRDEVEIEPIIKGALSSQTLWPGVENVPAIAGFKRAIELSLEDFDGRIRKLSSLRDFLMDSILDSVPDSILNGPRGDERVSDNVNISFLHVEGEALTVELSMRGVYVSSGSACTSRILEPSHVMLAIGRKHEEAHGSILFKLTRYHEMEDMRFVVDNVKEAVGRLRSISPLGR
ncbi:cysteine desulfurase [Candidatus Korarchaeum cryptofilum]|jgi:cysteine desulfurase|uniref:cysteine desulfurase n=1 Tax=Candidatus Korarchaeum cryptofilum TaxID=498846 RepID=A0A429GAQ9_9CREN|nr:cysteine desulfurase family protein [Candidatus Korarchaeum cryptofilum]RSN70886.1 cysteine desulfurase [Candidatus Korarchaeum cryptofilum]